MCRALGREGVRDARARPLRSGHVCARYLRSGPVCARPPAPPPPVCQRTYRVWVPEMVQREIQVTVMRPTTEQVPYEYTVTLCRSEARTQTVTLCEYQTEQQQREIQVTVMRPTVEEVPYQYTVQLCRTETRTQTVTVCAYQTEQRTREIPYTVCVPEQRVSQCQVTTWRCVPEQRTCQYTVMVPYQEQCQVPVQVCRMVQQTITVAGRALCTLRGLGLRTSLRKTTLWLLRLASP